MVLGPLKCSHGWFRDVWNVENDALGPPLIVKTTRFMHDCNEETMAMMRTDAAIMTLLADSPRIIDVFGSCATTVSVKKVGKKVWDIILPLEKFVEHESGQYIDPRELHDEREVRPINNLTVTEKVEMALNMSGAIAEVHGFKGGVIVHDDMTPDQWLWNNDGSIILTDFNRAVILEYDVDGEDYCADCSIDHRKNKRTCLNQRALTCTV